MEWNKKKTKTNAVVYLTDRLWASMHTFAYRVMIQDTFAYRPNLALEYPDGFADACWSVVELAIGGVSEGIPVRCT